MRSVLSTLFSLNPLISEKLTNWFLFDSSTVLKLEISSCTDYHIMLKNPGYLGILGENGCIHAILNGNE